MAARLWRSYTKNCTPMPAVRYRTITYDPAPILRPSLEFLWTLRAVSVIHLEVIRPESRSSARYIWRKTAVNVSTDFFRSPSYRSMTRTECALTSISKSQIFIDMHSVGNQNQAEIPIEEIERMLTARAVPDFTGTVTIQIRVKPTAGHEVEFLAEVQSTHQVNRAIEKTAPIVTNNRVNQVRMCIREHQHRFVLTTKVLAIKASYVSGEIRSFHVFEVEECAQPKAATAKVI